MSAPQATANYDPITAEARSLLFRTAHYLTAEDQETLEKTCAFAFAAHATQTRKSGEPYITHPIAVTIELAKWHMDLQTLSAGLLHDVLEDTGVGKATLAQAFGETIAEMVDGLSKLEKLEYNNHVEHQAESFQKLIMAMTKDVRVIIVKLSDRLHNMRTLDSMRLEKRRRIAHETLEIYAPIANRIGLNSAFRELQDLSFKNLYPKRYETLRKAMQAFHRNRRDVIGTVLSQFSLRLVSENIEAQIKGREKHLYSIHQKMRNKGLRFDEVMDIYGFRVTVNSISACYAALGALHSLYPPKPGKIKDYIAIPKGNGYQSLHTTLSGPRGLPIEVQIRTRDMDAVAESGIASHWAYKSGNSNPDQATLNTNKWLQNILDLQARSANAIEFLEHIKVDLYPNEVYIFTPKGKILVLPRGATPIDFAYAIHTDVGNRTIAARINNTLMPLRSKLKTGDTVEIITEAQARPNPAWLNFAVSSRARSAIRSYLKNISRHDAIELGEVLLQKALSSLLPKDALLSEELKEAYLADLNTKQTSFEEVLYDVGLGNILPVSVAMQIAQLAGHHLGNTVKLSPVKISGNEARNVRLAECCNPIAGDSIRAVLLKDKGMVIHRDICPNLLKADPHQQLDANWDAINNNGNTFKTTLLVASEDTKGLLAAMATAFSGEGANIQAVDTPSKEQSGVEGFIEFKFYIETSGVEQLNRIIHTLHHIPQVRRVTRL